MLLKSLAQFLAHGKSQLSGGKFIFHWTIAPFGERNGNPLQRIPGTGEPDELPSMGSHRVGHDWSSSIAPWARKLFWLVCFIPCSQHSTWRINAYYLLNEWTDGSMRADKREQLAWWMIELLASNNVLQPLSKAKWLAKCLGTRVHPPGFQFWFYWFPDVYISLFL